MAINWQASTVLSNLGRTAKKIPLNAAAALYQEALRIEEVSKSRTPVDTGALLNSHEVSVPSIQGNDIEVTIKVGGPAAKYAVAVHERTELNHTIGQAKFLESAVLEASGSAAVNISKKVDL